jgi:excisionase family DNA binding protein
MIIYASIRLSMNEALFPQPYNSSDFELLTIAEAAKLLKVSTVTLHRWIKQGRLPAYHVGPRKVRIRRSDLAKAFTPTYPEEEVSALKESLTIKPLTDAEVREQLTAIEKSQEFIERMRRERGGKPLDSSAPLIRQAREERSKQLL